MRLVLVCEIMLLQKLLHRISRNLAFGMPMNPLMGDDIIRVPVAQMIQRQTRKRINDGHAEKYVPQIPVQYTVPLSPVDVCPLSYSLIS